MQAMGGVVRAVLFSVGCVLLTSFAPGQQFPPDLVMFNGKIFTSNTRQPYVDALAIRGDRIVAVGTSRDALALVGKNTKCIDLAGHTVVPGINDAHNHLSVAPEAESLSIKSEDPKWKEVKDALVVACDKAPKGKWIEGTFGDAILADPLPTRRELDGLCPDQPVALVDWTGHASILNSLALAKLAVREDEPDPQGGKFVRGSDGKLTGRIFEFAQFQIDRRLSELVNDEEAVRQLNEFFAHSARMGITTIQNMSVPITDDRAAALLAKSPPPIRIRLIWFGFTDQHGRVLKDRRDLPLHPAPLVTVSGTKWIIDGTPIEHSAAMRKPYADRPDTSGELNFSEKEMKDILRESLQRNDQLMVHVVGDRTVEAFLRAMEATGGEKVWGQRRVRFEHGDGIMPDLIPAVKRLGVVEVQNPTHLSLDLPRWGPGRAEHDQPMRSLLEAGIPVAIGSDGPDNPFLNIQLATTYEGKPNEALTREQAVIAYTLTSAYAEFLEKDKGSLEPGKLADLAVLSQDIFNVSAEDLPKTESVVTMVGGKIVYDAKVVKLAESNSIGCASR
jgi:predicted amidohydrolase YtcJ